MELRVEDDVNDIRKERHNGAHRYVVLMVTVDSDPGFLLFFLMWILTIAIGRCDVEA